MNYIAASQQGARNLFWFHFWGDLMSSIFLMAPTEIHQLISLDPKPEQCLRPDLRPASHLSLSVCAVPAQVPVDSPERAAGLRADGPAAETAD